MPTNTKLKNAVKLALAMSTGALALTYANTAVAQDGADELEEVLVTGSRIPRKDFTSNAPVATIDAGQIEMTNTINTESLLNTLPQTVPGLDRTSNNPGNGTATVDLRGLGTNRTLVLINGTRVVPTTLGGTVDINTIPNALIKDIEVLTGGASAVYGSDAVAGVVNFILKDDFEGASFNVSHEVTQEGDASLTSADMTIGANIADDRGNVVFNFAVTDREELFQGDRDFSFFAQRDTTDANGNIILVNGGSTGVPGTSVFAGSLGTFSPDSFGGIFESDGSFRPFQTGEVNDYYNYAPVNYIQLPQTRYQSSAMGSFKATDNVELYGRAMFTYSKVPSQLAPTPIFESGAEFTLDGSPFLDAAAQSVLSDAFGNGVDTDGDGIDDTASMFVRRRLLEVGPRQSDDTRTSFQVQAGVKGNITDTWTYDAYLQHGRVTNASAQQGNVNRGRFNQALLLDLSDPSGRTCADPSSNGSTVACAPINIFGEGNISADGAAFLRTAVNATTEFEQLVGAVTLAGDLGAAMELPGGRIGVAVGYEHREDDGFFAPSQDLAASTIAGFNGSPPSGGGFDVDAFYGEAYLPILDNLELELAARTSDYTTAGNVSSYKVAGSWSPIDQLRIRGGFNTAVRAPNIGELFAPLGENFPGAADPCSDSGSPATGVTAAIAAICTATGVPAGVVGSPAINPASGQVRAVSGGNSALEEESAETITFGVVVTPDFVEGLTFSVDYFEIEIDDAIASFGGGASNVLNTCYDPSASNGGAGSDFCNVINRRADGTIDFIELTTQNVALVTQSGIDFAASYNTELYGGDLGIQYLGTVTTENDFVAFEGDDVIECAGKFGANCGEPIQEYGHRVSFNWNRDAWTGQLIWRYVGETDDDDDDTLYAVEKLDAENYFDASGSYQFNDRYSVSFGIDNLFDTDPPILGDNGEQANTYPATYDVFGRTFFLRGSATF